MAKSGLRGTIRCWFLAQLAFGAFLLLLLGPVAWSETAGEPSPPEESIYETEEYYQHFARESCRVVMFRDPEIRENHIMENLKYQVGPKSEVLRLLWWVRETEAPLREELLIQWLCEKESLPDKDWVKANLSKLIKTYTTDATAIRMEEVDRVYPLVSSEKAKRSELKTISGAVSRVRALDLLTEQLLFDADVDQRRQRYAQISHLRSVAEDLANGSALVVLWLAEPDTTLRNSYLLPRFGGVSFRFMTSNIEPLLSSLRDSERETRLAEIQAVAYKSELSAGYIATLQKHREFREPPLFENVAYLKGEGAQLLRLFWWVRETEAKLRKELLLQWLCEKGVLPSKESVKTSLTRLMNGYVTDAVTKRMAEIDELWPSLAAEKQKRATIETLSAPSSGNVILDALDEDFLVGTSALSQEGLYSTLPYPSAGERAKRGGDTYSCSVLIMLWLAESEADLRQEHICPRIQASMPEFPSRFKKNVLEPLLEEPMTAEDASVRRAEIHSLH